MEYFFFISSVLPPCRKVLPRVHHWRSDMHITAENFSYMLFLGVHIQFLTSLGSEVNIT